MIITRLAGGLGNQMFQYAIARSYQRKETEKVILDLRMLRPLETDVEKIIQRPYALGIFKTLKGEKLDGKLLEVFTSNKFLARLQRRIFTYNTEYIIQDGMIPIDIRNSKKKNVYLEGNFQSELFFNSIRTKLIHDFSFPVLDCKNESIKRLMLNTPNSVSVHIRRGDYLSSSNKSVFGSVNLNYYKNAINNLQVRLEVAKLDAFVFTDDIKWVIQNFHSDKLNVKFIEGNYVENSWKDLYLMSCCQHHIIANSSFSWWGAWLSQREGITMAPKYWYLPSSNAFDIYDIIPKAWTIIDYNL